MISKTGTHAIRALACLAASRGGEFTGAAELARQVGAPRNYLGKLLRTLTRAGLLESRKGLGGGVRLARDPETITLLQVLDPFEHLTRWDGCVLGREVCSDRSPCAVHDRWAALRDSYLAVLAETTLDDIVSHALEQASGGAEAGRVLP